MLKACCISWKMAGTAQVNGDERIAGTPGAEAVRRGWVALAEDGCGGLEEAEEMG